MYNMNKQERQQRHRELTEKWLNRSARDVFTNKTPIENIPLRMEHGSSSHHPDREGGITTCDLVLWCKFLDGKWFRPYGGFTMEQIHDMITICSNDQQVEILMELLSATKYTEDGTTEGR